MWHVCLNVRRCSSSSRCPREIKKLTMTNWGGHTDGKHLCADNLQVCGTFLPGAVFLCRRSWITRIIWDDLISGNVSECEKMTRADVMSEGVFRRYLLNHNNVHWVCSWWKGMTGAPFQEGRRVIDKAAGGWGEAEELFKRVLIKFILYVSRGCKLKETDVCFCEVQ